MQRIFEISQRLKRIPFASYKKVGFIGRISNNEASAGTYEGPAQT